MKLVLRFCGVLVILTSIFLIPSDTKIVDENYGKTNTIQTVYRTSHEENKRKEKDLIVYKNMTKEELIKKLEPYLNSTLEGYTETLVDYAIANDVDPIIATSIILLETGCTRNCSKLVKQCNNVGGQKGGSTKCGNGSYAKFSSLDSGIKAFINNLSKNYIKKGLTTPELINKKYATSTEWANKVRNYMKKIESS